MSRASTRDLPEAEVVDGMDFEATDAAEESEPEGRSSGWEAFVAVLQALLVVVVLAGGGAGAYYLLRTGPKAKRRTPEPRATLVSVCEATRSAERAVVHAMGTVRAAQTIDLKPRVTGEIVEVSPECVPGGRFRAGDPIAWIDPADYKLAVEELETQIKQLGATIDQKRADIAQRESDIAKAASAVEQSDSEILQRQAAIVQAEAALAMERGQQAVAQREYELLGRELSGEDRDLVLREAQKRSAEAAVEAAEAAKAATEVALRKAKLDLDRATVRAPFNAVVDAETVDKGSQVSAQTALATLVGTDEYWVEVLVPVDQLQWVRVPRTAGEKGSTVRIYNEAAWGEDVHREGTVVRMASALEPEGRMARLLAVVPDPLGLAEESGRVPVLLIDSYVRVEIDGRELGGVVPIERDLVHEGDRVWVMNAQGKLDIRKVTVAFRGRERLLVIDGLAPGEKLVTTNLAAPVAGTPLRTGSAVAPGTAVSNAVRAPGTKTEGSGQ